MAIGMLNIITGLFVDAANRVSQKDRENLYQHELNSLLHVKQQHLSAAQSSVTPHAVSVLPEVPAAEPFKELCPSDIRLGATLGINPMSNLSYASSAATTP